MPCFTCIIVGCVDVFEVDNTTTAGMEHEISMGDYPPPPHTHIHHKRRELLGLSKTSETL
jgi:hypothetical protein